MALCSQARTGVICSKQLGFSDYELTKVKKQTKREKFLSEMKAVVTWQALIELIEPHHPRADSKSIPGYLASAVSMG